MTNPGPNLQMATVLPVDMHLAPALSEFHTVHAPGPPPGPQAQQRAIMCMDEDDFQSDNEPVGQRSKVMACLSSHCSIIVLES